MSDQLRDFRYYADKAEQQIQDSYGRHTAETKERFIRRAELYVRLAAAAPDPAPPTPCNVRLHAHSPMGFTGESRACVFTKGHTGQHETSDGVRFDGLKAEFPMPDND